MCKNETIRPLDVPNEALYQAEPRPDEMKSWGAGTLSSPDRHTGQAAFRRERFGKRLIPKTARVGEPLAGAFLARAPPRTRLKNQARTQRHSVVSKQAVRHTSKIDRAPSACLKSGSFPLCCTSCLSFFHSSGRRAQSIISCSPLPRSLTSILSMRG